MAGMAINAYTQKETSKGNEPENRSNGIDAFFSPDSFSKLSSIMNNKTVMSGSYLFWEGEAADHLYYVKKGRVKLTKTTDSGNKMTLYLHHAGDLFGQMDPFQTNTQTFNAEVIEDAEFGIIEQKDLELLLWQHKDLAIAFMKWMGVMHRMTQSKFRDLMLYGKTGALSSLLIRLCNSYGVRHGNMIRIDKKMNNSEMAEMIGATRESVNRLLNDMRKEDVISIEHGTIYVKDLAYLRQICKCENCPLEVCRV